MRVQGCAHYCRSDNFFPANILTHVSLKLDKRDEKLQRKKKSFQPRIYQDGLTPNYFTVLMWTMCVLLEVIHV